MKIRRKLLIVILLLLVAVTGGVFISIRQQSGRFDSICRDEVKERQETFEKTLQYRAYSLASFVNDYTFWDDMVRFLRTGDRRWAAENIDTGMRTFRADAVWVFDRDFTLVYATSAIPSIDTVSCPVPLALLHRRLEEKRLLSFFVNTPRGIMEVQAATIHPTADPGRRTPPRGYFFVGRLWGQGYLGNLDQQLGGTCVLSAPGGKLLLSDGDGPRNGVIHCSRLLTDWEGKALARMDICFVSGTIRQLARDMRHQFSWLLLYNALMLLLVGALLLLWVWLPLRNISRTLDSEDLSHTRGLLDNNTEYGHIARLIKRFFEQKAELLGEVERRRRAEETLRRSRNHLRAILDNISDFAWLKDREGRYIAVNHPLSKTRGVTPEIIVGKKDEDFWPPEISAAHLAVDREVMETGKRRIVEECVEDPDGRQRWIETIKSPVYDDKGGIIGTAGVARDITERRQTDELLRIKTTAIASSVAGIAITGPSGHVTYANDACQRMWGYGLSELAGKHSGMLWLRRKDALDVTRALLSRGHWVGELQARRKDDTIFDAYLSANMVYNAEGKVLCVIASVIDITEIKKVERELRESERKYRELADTLPEVVFELDEKGNSTFLSQAATRYFGYPHDHFRTIEDTYSILVPEDRQRFRENYQRLVNGEVLSGGMEYRVRRRDGSILPVIVYTTPIVEEGMFRGLRGIVIDISDRKKVEESMRSAREQAELANRTKSQFLANMSHEIRTPMNSIIGFVELLQKTPLTGQQKEYLDTVSDSGRLLLEIINDILDISKIESGEMKLERVDFDLRAVVEDSVRIVRHRLEEKGLGLSVAVDQSLPRCFEGDPLRIKQVLLNLLNNAVKFTDAGSIDVGVTVKERRADGRWVIRCSVRDTGIGIPPEKRESIFEPFVQADMSISRRFGGTGLGLSICGKLVRLMEGSIWVESEPGKGSDFVFLATLREKESTAAALPCADQEAENAAAACRDARVLVVEDNPVNRKLIGILLKNLGCITFMACNGREALELLKTDRFDLCLMDLQMPEMGGLEATKAIRGELRCTMPVIALTACAMRDEETNCYEAGMNDYLPKPVDVKLLTAKLARWLRRS